MHDADRFGRLLAEARGGDANALGELLDDYRGYLLLIASEGLSRDLQAKCGPSDLVQQTFLEAHRDFGRFVGESEGGLRAWLREVLRHNIANFGRDFRATGKRAVGREVPLPTPDSPSAGPGDIGADTLTPSQHVAADEEAAALRRAVAELPENYRAVVRMRYEEGLPFETLAARLGTTSNAARKLWSRAVEALQDRLEGLR